MLGPWILLFLYVPLKKAGKEGVRAGQVFESAPTRPQRQYQSFMSETE
jgi:hypothetical protein